MADYHFDSSGLVKLYVNEPGSLWVRQICARGSGNNVYIPRIGIAEVVAAVTRRRRDEAISQPQQDRIIAKFLYDAKRRFQIVEIQAKTTRQSVALLRQHPLRAYDALQLAVALWTNARLHVSAGRKLIFVCADRTLLSAATTEGLATENPNDH